VKANEERGRSIAVPQALSTELNRYLADYGLFTSHGLDLYLVPGNRFKKFEEAVGILRELTYRQQLSGSGRSHDLDSRDAYYDHFLLVERSSGEIAGCARLQFIPQQPERQQDGTRFIPTSHQSYLEHVYPGIKAKLTKRGNNLEIGRVALAPRFQRLPHTLMCLFRGGLQVALSSGYNSIHGLVSYNHFAYSDTVNNSFLSRLIRPPFADNNKTRPQPRHPHIGISYHNKLEHINTIQDLEKHIQTKLASDFRLPILLRQYINLMGARVENLSLALDFNQITEILMSADLTRIPESRLQHFTGFDHQAVYKKFEWYRGPDSGGGRMLE
jgi:hypothetical protein